MYKCITSKSITSTSCQIILSLYPRVERNRDLQGWNTNWSPVVSINEQITFSTTNYILPEQERPSALNFGRGHLHEDISISAEHYLRPSLEDNIFCYLHKCLLDETLKGFCMPEHEHSQLVPINLPRVFNSPVLRMFCPSPFGVNSQEML